MDKETTIKTRTKMCTVGTAVVQTESTIHANTLGNVTPTTTRRTTLKSVNPYRSPKTSRSVSNTIRRSIREHIHSVYQALTYVCCRPHLEEIGFRIRLCSSSARIFLEGSFECFLLCPKGESGRRPLGRVQVEDLPGSLVQ